MKASFQHRVREAIDNAYIQEALNNSPERWRQEWSKRLNELGGGDSLRERAQEIRREVIENLDTYIDQFTSSLQKNDIHVHRASDSENACACVLRIAQAHGARMITKSKSMVTEEIGLNHALSEACIEPIETDLGEFIIQKRGETPAHIVAPAIHLRREDVAETFSLKLGMKYTTEIEHMTSFARSILREKFLTSDIGISGINFGVAETGTLCLVTNEGNGRMVTTVPPIHIAIMGLERILPTLDDLCLMLQLLPRAATGQKISSYVSLIQGPRSVNDPDGPEERHLILVDNGRLSIARSSMSEVLHCIRCGACLNVCPVYRRIGGHAYDSVYSGPIGAVVSPSLFGLKRYGHLAKASTLCGACRDVCPVYINLPRLLLRVREQYSRIGTNQRLLKWILRLYEWVMLNPERYNKAQRLGTRLLGMLPRREGWLTWVPPPLSPWTRARHFPPLATHSFRHHIKGLIPKRDLSSIASGSNHRSIPEEARGIQVVEQKSLKNFSDNLTAIGGELIECSTENATQKISYYLDQLPHRRLLSWSEDDTFIADIIRGLKNSGFEFIDFNIPWGMKQNRCDSISTAATADVGITSAIAGLADTGTLVIPSGKGRPQLASLLPPIHIAVLSADMIYPTMDAWLLDGGKQLIETTSYLSLISGPSKSADIESTLTVGVHGPARVLVFCLL